MVKKLTVILIILNIFVLKTNAQNEQGINFEKLDAYIQNSMQEWSIPGMAVAVIQGDSIAFAKGYGVKEFSHPEKVNTKTLFAVASNTKSFTSAAISLLIDEGKLDWDDKVIDYVPYFRMYNSYVTENMTIRDLLCHRSGLKTFSGDLLWYESTYTTKEVIERARFLEPEYGFRSHFGYSNIMFAVAGEVIKSASGKEWKDFIQEKFIEPLEMKESLLSVKDLKGKTNIAIPHHIEEGKNPLSLEYMNWDNIAPAAALISNVENMSNWLIMQMNDGKFKDKEILSKKQVWEMHTPQTPDAMSMGWASYFPKKNFTSYALGWEVFNYEGLKVINHGGGADGMISKTMFVPKEKFGIVILTNSINYLPTSLMYYLLDDYLGEPNDWSDFYKRVYNYGLKIDKHDKEEAIKNRNPNTKPSLSLEEYTGTYKSELYGNIKVSLDSAKLVVKFIPTPKFIGDLEHWQYNTFTIHLRHSPTLPNGTVNFIINAKGKVEEMKIDIPNPDFDFTEIKLKKI